MKTGAVKKSGTQKGNKNQKLRNVKCIKIEITRTKGLFISPLVLIK